MERMLYHAAHAASNKRFPFHEAITEAYWAYMKCCESYDGSRGMRFSSWVFYKVHRHLKTHIKDLIEDSQKLLFMEIKDDICGASPLRRSLEEALETRDDLCSDERELLKLILDPPFSTLRFGWDEMREIKEFELVKAIKEHLGFERGLDSTYVDITLYNLKAKLTEKQLCL